MASWLFSYFFRLQFWFPTTVQYMLFASRTQLVGGVKDDDVDDGGDGDDVSLACKNMITCFPTISIEQTPYAYIVC